MSVVTCSMTEGYTTRDLVSTGVYPDTLNLMTERLGTFIHQERTKRGWTQVELASRAGVPKQTVNRLETGTTKLPGALIRRQIAEALGVRHIDLLIAAGEITADEVNLPADLRSSAVQQLAPIIDRYDWTEQDLRTIAQLINSLGQMKSGTLEVPDVE